MVKCVDCGYLGLRQRRSRVLVEMERAIRETGHLPWYPIQNPNSYQRSETAYDSFAICAAGKSPPVLHVYLHSGEVGAESNQEFVTAITTEIECDAHRQFVDGFTPKEHREMVDREQLRKWQADREDADRQWRECQDKKRDDRQAALLWQLAGVAGAFTLVGAIFGATVAALLAR